MKKSVIILLLLITGIANGQIRQRSTTKGFSAAAQIHMLGWASTYFKYMDKNAPTGFGGGIRLGYGITELIEPYIGFDFTSLSTKKVDAESFKMSHIDIGVRFNFAGTVHPVRPFVEGGYTARKGVIKQVISGNTYVDADFKGGTPHVGGGLSYFPSIPISIFAKGVFTVGKKSTLVLDGVEQTEKADVTTFRVSIGANFNLSELAGKK